MTFSPPRVAISAITQANPCVVTTASNHNMTTGQVVRLHVPLPYGMVQLNQIAASITVLSATTFSLQATQVPPAVTIDSTNYTAFTIPSKPQFTAEVLPIGAGPTTATQPDWAITNNVCNSLVEDAITNIDTTEIPF